MWTRFLSAQDQRNVGTDWQVVLDQMVEIRSDNGRSLTDPTHSAKLQVVCNKILKHGFSPTAMALQLLIDLRTSGIGAVNRRVISIAEFLDAQSKLIEQQDWMSGDGMTPLAELFASEPFLLPLARSCRFLRNSKGLVIGEGSVSDDSFDDYRRSGAGYTFIVKEVDTEELRVAYTGVAQVGEALERLQTVHQFLAGAYRSIIREIELVLGDRVPNLGDASGTAETLTLPSTAVVPAASNFEPAPAGNPVVRLLDRCLDAWDRPYLESAKAAFEREITSLHAALAAVAVLPPALEDIAPLLAEDVMDGQAPRGHAVLPSGLDTPEALRVELEKQGSHRVTRIYLRRVTELAAQDDVARIKALTEDRERWHRVIESRLTSPSVLLARLAELLNQWLASDPGSPAMPHLFAAKQQLERTSPVAEGERLESTPVLEPTGASVQLEATKAQSASTLRRQLEKLVMLAPRVTGNPLALEALRRALDISSATLQNPKGTP